MIVAILYNSIPPDAPPDEQDVLVQLAAVQDALKAQGHSTEAIPCDLDLAALRRRLGIVAPDAIFNLVETLEGHGRLIHLVPDLLDALGVRYAGCPAGAIYVTSNKLLSKHLLHAAGLPTPPWYHLDDDLIFAGDTAPEDARFIVKSVWEDASVGLDDDAIVPGDQVRLRSELAARQGTPGAPFFAELFIEGREFNLSIVGGPEGPLVLPAAEMLFEDYPEGKPRIVGYAAKWAEDSFEYSHTVRRFDIPHDDHDLLESMACIAKACWRLFGLDGWARVDFRVDRDGRPWVLEVNANPCLSLDSGFAAACARAGLDFHQAIGRILERSLQADRGSSHHA